MVAPSTVEKSEMVCNQYLLCDMKHKASIIVYELNASMHNLRI